MWLSLALIFVVALGVRLHNIAVTGAGVAEIHDDAVDYHMYALNLIHNGTYIDGEGHRACRLPGYPMFLAAVYSVFGERVSNVQVFQSVLNAIACVLLYFIARVLLSGHWALLPSLIAAFYFDFFTGSARILSECAYSFALVVFLCCWFTLDRTKLISAFGLGLLAGICTYFRPEVLAFGAAASLFVTRSTQWKRRLSGLLLFWFGIGVMLTPWVVRNERVLHAFVPLTSRAGAGAYVGLQWHMSRLGVVKNEQFVPLSASEVADNELQFEKAKKLYSTVPAATIIKSFIYNACVFVYPFHPAFDPTLFFCLPFWLIGAAVALSKKSPSAFLVLCLACFMSAYVVFGATAARYREPIAPVTVLLAAMGLFHLQKKLGRLRFGIATGSWAAINAVLFVYMDSARSMLLALRDRIW